MSEKKPAELLREEHQAVLQKLAALETIFLNLERREEVSPKLKELASFFKTDFWVHFDKEEKALFPEFSNYIPWGIGPLAVMLDEHEVIRATNDLMQQAIESYLAHDENPEVIKAIRQNGMHFIEFLRSHANKEDGIFPTLAEAHLKPAQNQKVVNLFVELDRAHQAAKEASGSG